MYMAELGPSRRARRNPMRPWANRLGTIVASGVGIFHCTMMFELDHKTGDERVVTSRGQVLRSGLKPVPCSKRRLMAIQDGRR